MTFPRFSYIRGWRRCRVAVEAPGMEPLRQATSGVVRYQRHRPETTLLYQLVEQHYPAFLDALAAQGRSLPGYVQQEFQAYLKCGRLEHGFLRVRCTQCHAERLVAFSCKRRGFCPSCGARRMTESAALLVDEVLPREPLRQKFLLPPGAGEDEGDNLKAHEIPAAGAFWCEMVYRAAMPNIDKPVRQSVSLPARVARRVKSLVKTSNTSANRVIVELIESGLEAREQERKRFLDLADHLARSRDPEEQKRVKEELARMTFGD